LPQFQFDQQKLRENSSLADSSAGRSQRNPDTLRQIKVVCRFLQTAHKIRRAYDGSASI